MKITLENNQEVEISQKLYNTFLDKAKGKPKIGQIYWYIDSLGEKDFYNWDNDSVDNDRLEIGNIYLTEEACDMAILRLKARALGDKVVACKEMYFWSYYDKKVCSTNLPQYQLDRIWFNTKEKCEEVMKKYEHAFTYLLK